MSLTPVTRLAGLVFPITLLCGCPDNNLGSINATPEATILSHQDGDSLFEGY